MGRQTLLHCSAFHVKVVQHQIGGGGAAEHMWSPTTHGWASESSSMKAHQRANSHVSIALSTPRFFRHMTLQKSYSATLAARIASDGITFLRWCYRAHAHVRGVRSVGLTSSIRELIDLDSNSHTNITHTHTHTRMYGSYTHICRTLRCYRAHFSKQRVCKGPMYIP